ncbi:MAG: aldehyde dehydrogenase family protein [Proteobacteria bacterium]|nr:aldehyde dehydrogenase family protein [Pseudomonadota bacterium]
MKEILSSLRDYFDTGQTFDIEWRKTQLRAIIEMLEKETVSLSKALHEDLGKSAEEAWLTEIGFVQHEARFVLRHVAKWARARRVKTPLFLMPGRSRIQPQPRGLALIISPWNYPAQLALSPLIASVAAGNVTVLKPSELSPACAKWFTEMIPKYLDPKAVAVIEAGPEKTSELLKEPFDFIFFTGSTKTAHYITRAAAEHLTPTVLELGGKSPCIVTNCNHIKTAASRIVFAKFLNAGQTCVAPDYILVEEKLKPQLIEALKTAITEQFGPENAPNNFVHIIHKGHYERLCNMLNHGEKILFGGKCTPETLHIAPTLIEADMSHPSMQEEIFGPILPILTLTETDAIGQALKLVAEHPTPLAAYLFSDRKEDVKRAKRLICGGFAHNDALMHLTNAHMPFGGVGQSGHGGSHGQFGFESFSHMRSELLQSQLDIPLRYPPFTESAMKWLRRFMH